MVVRRTSTIGSNPLDAVLPPVVHKAPPPVDSRGEVRQSKVRFTVHLPDGIVERARDAVYWTPGLTLAGLVERGLELVLAEKEAAAGARFAPRRGALRTGRPVR